VDVKMMLRPSGVQPCDRLGAGMIGQALRDAAGRGDDVDVLVAVVFAAERNLRPVG
jgi:hypothetical protein